MLWYSEQIYKADWSQILVSLALQLPPEEQAAPVSG